MSGHKQDMPDARQDVVNTGDPRMRSALYVQAEKIIEATRLIELGARAGLAQQLTGIEKAKVNRLYRQLKGRPSPSGQTPFSDVWYLKDKRRLLEASVAWGLYKKLAQRELDSARLLIDVYQSYQAIVSRPLLDLTRVFFIPQLVQMGMWQESRCQYCQASYLAPVEHLGHACPGCELYYRYRCRECGTALQVKTRGRYAITCVDCRTTKNQG